MRIIPDLLPDNHPLAALTMTPTSTKVCRRCGEEKPLDSFYAQSSKPDGKHPWCKECCRRWKRERKEEINARDRHRRGIDSEYRRRRADACRKWRQTHREQKRAYERARRQQKPDEYRERRERYASQNPEMVRALARSRARVYRAVRRGLLVRPDRCEWCGTPCKPEAAHYDYSKPLDVVWLCRPCHMRWDYHDPKYRKSKGGEAECG